MAAAGLLGVQLPPTGAPLNPQAKLILQGEPISAPVPIGLPGMAFGIKSGGWEGNLTENNVSVKGWLVDILSGWGDTGEGGRSLYFEEKTKGLTVKNIDL